MLSHIPGNTWHAREYLNFYSGSVPYLNSVLGQVSLEREHLPRVHVGVVSVLESLLQLVQLPMGEQEGYSDEITFLFLIKNLMVEISKQSYDRVARKN